MLGLLTYNCAALKFSVNIGSRARGQWQQNVFLSTNLQLQRYTAACRGWWWARGDLPRGNNVIVDLMPRGGSSVTRI